MRADTKQKENSFLLLESKS